MIKKLLILLAVFALAACTQTQKDFALVNTKGYLSSPDQISDLNEEIRSANRQFAFALYQQLLNNEKNVFFSPLSVQLALSMTANGAANSTLKEMLDVLRYSDVESMNEYSRLTQSYLLNQAVFSINNSIWIKEAYREKVKQPFLDNIVEHYGAMVATLDFSLSSASETMNQWVKENTNQRISQVVKPPIDPLTVMFLINTLTFQSTWDVPFEKKLTKNGVFANLDQEIQYVLGSRIVPYYEDDRVQMASMLTKDQAQEVLFVLPRQNVTLSNAELVDYLQKPLIQASVVVQLPKVMIQAETEMKETLGKMGMPGAFLDDIADFSNMATDARADGLHIFSVLHKTFWMLDEEGTEAAAVTKVEMQIKSTPQGDYSFIVNRPFTVVIRDKQTGLILFMGHIVNPQP
ncbi:MAG: serpin family protein [Erysipelotrichaceae bacterium]|nr:serpin family protein [Erysipelotrichaceae bacterium]